MSRSIWLAAVQARIDPLACRGSAVFAERVDELCARALEGRSPGQPALVCFPEVFALPLLFELDARGRAPRSLGELALGLLRRRPLRLLLAELRAPGAAGVLWSGAEAAASVYQEAFAGAARRHACHLVAGSLFLPSTDREPSRGEFAESRRVHNLSSIFNPGGEEIGRALKQHLTPGVERLCGVSAAAPRSASAVPLGWGRLGVLICLDAFFESEVRHMDNLGVEVLVQPSANDGWEQPWKHNRRFGTSYSEGELWMSQGLLARIQGREMIRYGVNPMLVGEYLGMRFAGRSSIVANAALCGGPPVRAQATGPAEEEVVTARVEL